MHNTHQNTVDNTKGFHTNGGDRNHSYLVSGEITVLQINSAQVKVRERYPTPKKIFFSTVETRDLFF